MRVDVFQGDRIAALEHVASGPKGAEFFAEAGRSYRIRVSHSTAAISLVLHWSQGPRPANDDFGAALPITDAEGAVEGDSQGATLEPGESFGPLASTVWYRWTAPGEGWWEFESSNRELRVLAFTGGNIGELRLVSDFPGRAAKFPASAGGEYHIAVASTNAYAAGGLFNLAWTMTEPTAGNDSIDSATLTGGTASGSRWVNLYRNASVAPDEPAATGVRTKWWVWTPRADGYVTWRLTNTYYAELQMAVFFRDLDEKLQLVGATGPVVTSTELAFQAVQGVRYWISVGLPTGGYSAFSFPWPSATLRWGPTPENDDPGSAASLTETSGSITGLSRFATTEPDQRDGLLGHSSVWYSYEAPTSGWYRFWVEESRPPMVLAVYRDVGGGLGKSDPIATSRGPEVLESNVVEVLFYAEAGVRYAIRLGTLGSDEGGQFSMHWEEADPPVWLRYVDRVAQGGTDSTGKRVALEELAGLAVNDLGTALYVASDLGLRVFERDVTTGNLAFGQLLEVPVDLTGASLIWDSDSGVLHAQHGCRGWLRFLSVDGTGQKFRRLERALPIGNFMEHYCADDAFMDSDGGIYVVDRYRYGQGRMWVFTIATNGDLRHVQTLKINQLQDALISNDDTRVYASTYDGSLVVFQRDGRTGELARIGEGQVETGSQSMAISADARYLFVLGGYASPYTKLFQLERQSAHPLLLGTLPSVDASLPFGNRAGNTCHFATVRDAALAVDVFCRDAAFSVEWRPDATELAATDYMASWQPDRFNNPVPEFGAAKGMAASPDGRHVYLATENSGILIFERVGKAVAAAGTVEDSDDYVRLFDLAVSPGVVSFGPFSSGGCIGLTDTTLGGITYSIGGSKWQMRSAAGGDRMDVEGTATTGEVCAYTPSAPGEYRLVAEITIDGEIGRYRSNTLVVDQ